MRHGDALARLAAAVVTREHPERTVVAVAREPVDVASSWALERVRIILDDGSCVERLLKHLDREAPGSGARATKPVVALDANREPWVYRHLLPRLDVGAPRCSAGPDDLSPSVPWLLLELVEGGRLSETSVGRPWEVAARGLARMHGRARTIFGDRVDRPGARACGRPERAARSGVGAEPDPSPLLDHGAELQDRWMARAVAFSESGDRRRRALIDSLRPAHGRAVALTRGGPSGFIHGEFYPSNILVERGTDAVRPVDWEMAGWGPLLLDLAALTSGLGVGDRRLLATAYRDEARAASLDLPPGRDFDHSLLACRLLLAVQWLGWSRSWTPPPEHRFDWTQEALRCAHELMS